MPWQEILGWSGSALLIYSVMQARVLRFRVLNLAACVVLTAYNAWLGIWPMVAMNIALCLINLWHLRGLARRHDDAAFEVLEVDPRDEYLRHVLRVHEDDVRRFQPDLLWDPHDERNEAFLVQRGDETVGMVLLQDEGDGLAQVLLDYVTPRFRDYSPGEFVWKRSGLLRDKGFTRVRTPAAMVNPYYRRLGFEQVGDSWELRVSP